jgi:hypothetical protein
MIFYPIPSEVLAGVAQGSLLGFYLFFIALCNSINPLCTKLIIWQYSSTCHHNKTPTEKRQLIGNPVYT